MTRERINRPLLAFIVIGTLILMAIPQDYAVVPGSALYWAIWSPVLLSFFATHKIIRYLFNEGWALTLFVVFTSAWFLAQGDIAVVVQTFALVWVTAWIAADGRKLPVDWLIWGLLFLFVAATGMYLTGRNVWGLLPYQTVGFGGDWRVSIFPNIAWTFSFLLPAALILTMNRDTRRYHQLALLAVAYFILMAQGRSAILALVLYWLLKRKFRGVGERREEILFTPIVAVAVVIGAMLLAAPTLYLLQDIPFVSLFLRGQTGLTFEQVQAQLYRPWLWAQHFRLFIESPFLLGRGSFDFAALIGPDPNGQLASGSESYLTRLLATYGLFIFLYFAVFIGRYFRRAIRLDTWACAASAAIVFMMMTYGSAFHPSSPINALCLFILFHGSDGFLATKKVRVRRRLREQKQAEPHGA